ncbi:hypothetical protein G647_03657 [Cladophialophora carrionii CBS 160.54]|uniref:Uncharacterized protein n=1 Tax=Cladophialophora carrionii CBS 160.54 TaxID=1279043 RepID=V9DD88_9EURO|nr:uncharacterized protein G647_03657 [Cladophialophora carrionii CBS 160.54]ETI24288.1 hypothetical protein G647_03657 [Cladophialophora carrionii CBS 160.54]
MDPPEVESDGFEVGDVFTGPGDYHTVLYYGHQRFVLKIRKPERREDGDILSDVFLRIEEAEKDPDEMAFHRCLEDFRELVILTCKHTMYTLAASAPRLNSRQASLEDFLHPTTFYL